jgi:hypothetical protein
MHGLKWGSLNDVFCLRFGQNVQLVFEILGYIRFFQLALTFMYFNFMFFFSCALNPVMYAGQLKEIRYNFRYSNSS